jgi:hypothetical protein
LPGRSSRWSSTASRRTGTIKAAMIDRKPDTPKKAADQRKLEEIKSTKGDNR